MRKNKEIEGAQHLRLPLISKRKKKNASYFVSIGATPSAVPIRPAFE